jgi:hypothetical protein
VREQLPTRPDEFVKANISQAAKWVIPFAAFGCLLAAACGGNSGTPAPSVIPSEFPSAIASPISGTPAEQPRLPVRDAVIPSKDLPGFMDGASDFQRALFADGRLTFAEYEGAILSLTQCFKDHGLTIVELNLNARNKYEMAIGLVPGDVERSKKSYDQCRQEYYSIVEQVWLQNIQPSESELQSARDDLAACLRLRGYELPEHPASQDFHNGRISDADLVGCGSQTGAKFGLEAYVG